MRQIYPSSCLLGHFSKSWKYRIRLFRYDNDYDDLDEAIEIANDTVYGLAGYVYGEEPKLLAHVAKSLKAGRITINNEDGDFQRSP